jgi:Domain of unknown function (DUF4388)
MQGNLSETNLDELLSFATEGRKSGILKLCHGHETVDLFLQDGDIIHAICPIGEGEKAIYYPLTWGNGTFKLEDNGAAPAATVKRNAGEILADLRAMSREWKSIVTVIPSGQCIFQLADLDPELNGPITIPYAAWRVLCRIDGRRTVQEIAVTLKAPYVQTAKIIFNLSKAGLIAIVPSVPRSPATTVSPELLAGVVAQLTEVIGPIAPFVVRDQIRALDESPDNFPQNKLDELIGLLSREISDAKFRSEFETSIAREFAVPKPGH